MKYCGAKCQRKHWKAHKVLCGAINQLSKAEEEVQRQKCEFDSHFSPKDKQFVTKLVGKRCMINCKLAGSLVKALWDTGAQVSLISKAWLEANTKDVHVRDLSSILDTILEIEGVSGAKIPYEGYVEIDVKIGNLVLHAPFLVTKDPIIQPIIGFNIIEMMAKMLSPIDKDGLDQFREAFDDVSGGAIEALVAFLNTERQERLGKVVTYKYGALIPANSSLSIPCRVDGCIIDRRMPVVFEPTVDYSIDEGLQFQESFLNVKKGPSPRVFITVSNTTSRGIKLSGKTCLGELHLVRSVIPTEVTLKDQEEIDMMPPEQSDPIQVEENMQPDNGEAPHQRDLKEEDLLTNAVPNEDHHKRDSVEKGNSLTTDVKVEKIARIAVTSVKDENDPSITSDEFKFREQLNQLDFGGLTESEEKLVKGMLWTERESFAMNPDDIGDAQDLQMDLNTTDEVPVQRSYISIPKPLVAEVKAHIQDLLNRGFIRPSKSSWCSPVVIVRKKSGDMRLCVDFRSLNNKTLHDRHPLPRIQETLDNLGGKCWFSVLDQSKAYYQGHMGLESRKKTAFVTPWGLYEFVRIPFGLTNAPATFQRYMEDTLRDYRDNFAMPYLDDVIVYSDNFKDHVDHIQKVLQKLREKGLKLKLDKCSFFQQKVKFLGRVISKDGYSMDPDSIAAVQALKNFTPQTVGQVRQMLGLLGYHRRNIQDFASIAKPLTDLLLSDTTLGGDHKEKIKGEKSEKGKDKSVPSKKRICWEQKHQVALNSLIDMTTSAPILAYPDYTEPFYLHTDASQVGLGCILYQKQQGMTRVIGYGSRSLKPAEKNYHSTKLEFLALKWAVTEQFRDYLAYADHFDVYTDNNPLVYIMNSKKVNANSQRWISELSEFHFTIHYRPGVINRDADCLSRLPLDFPEYSKICTEEVGLDTFQALVTGVLVQQNNCEAWVMSVGEKEPEERNDTKVRVTIEELKNAQSKDVSISQVMKVLQKEAPKSSLIDSTSEVKHLMREVKRLSIDKDGILKRQCGKIKQIVLPKSLRQLIYRHLHEEMGHLGVERTHQLARQRVYWPKMFSDIEEYIHKKCLCVVKNPPAHQKFAPLQSIHSSSPMELVCIDFLHLEKSSGNHEYILLIVDHFSRYAQGYPCKNKEALTAAKHLYGDFVLRFGLPGKILHDQGREFENKLFSELEKLTGIEKLRTTPYHPQCNGAVERMNSTLLKMLRTLPEKWKTKWHDSVNKMLFAYNATRHDSTGYSPYFLLFGREAILPIDFVLGLEDDKEPTSYSNYVRTWRNQMEEAYGEARRRSDKRKERDASRNNQKPLLASLEPGDFVLVRNTIDRGGPGKIRSYWDPNPYVVKEIMGESKVVYAVEKVDGGGNRRVLHRNMLMPCDPTLCEKLLGEQEKTKELKPKLIIKTRSQKKSINDVSSDDTEMSEEENVDYDAYERFMNIIKQPASSTKSQQDQPEDDERKEMTVPEPAHLEDLALPLEPTCDKEAIQESSVDDDVEELIISQEAIANNENIQCPSNTERVHPKGPNTPLQDVPADREYNLFGDMSNSENEATFSDQEVLSAASDEHEANKSSDTKEVDDNADEVRKPRSGESLRMTFRLHPNDYAEVVRTIDGKEEVTSGHTAEHKRERNAPKKFTYDEMGKPTINLVTDVQKLNATAAPFVPGLKYDKPYQVGNLGHDQLKDSANYPFTIEPIPHYPCSIALQTKSDGLLLDTHKPMIWKRVFSMSL